MKAFTNLIVMALVLLGSMMMVSSFVTQRQLNPLVTSSSTSSTTSLYFFDAFSAPKDDGTPGDYVCKVKYLSSHFNHSCRYNHKHASIFSGSHAAFGKYRTVDMSTPRDRKHGRPNPMTTMHAHPAVLLNADSKRSQREVRRGK
jgi:hypothetical protein